MNDLVHTEILDNTSRYLLVRTPATMMHNTALNRRGLQPGCHRSAVALRVPCRCAAAAAVESEAACSTSPACAHATKQSTSSRRAALLGAACLLPLAAQSDQAWAAVQEASGFTASTSGLQQERPQGPDTRITHKVGFPLRGINCGINCMPLDTLAATAHRMDGRSMVQSIGRRTAHKAPGSTNSTIGPPCASCQSRSSTTIILPCLHPTPLPVRCTLTSASPPQR